jgi:deoxyribodipyrimidine photo-lyase
MSPYLHFGQISPLQLALKTSRAPDSLGSAKDAYIEQLVVRRELAMNFATYTDNYDAYRCIPGWAQKTLADHRQDKREYVYSRRQLENAACWR